MSRQTSYELLASVVFEPYIPGSDNPTFALTLSDTGRRDEYGKHIFHYRLTITDPQHYHSEYVVRAPQTRVLFEAEDYHAHYVPTHNFHDLDSVIEGIMGFLTLRPGDTDEEYFKNYTHEQLDYCERFAEALMCEVQARYGDH